MIRKYISLTVIFTLLCISSVWSQSILGTQYPFGLTIRPGTGSSLALGGTGIGVQNDFYGMTENPANLGIMNRAVFALQTNLDFLNIFENGNYSNHASLSPNLLSFCFPLQKFGSIGMSFSRLSSTNTKFLENISKTIDGVSTDYNIFLMSEGGSVAWQVGWGYSIKKLMQFGITYSRYYFNNTQTKAMVANGIRSDTINVKNDLSYATNGIRGGLLVPVKKLTLGFSGEYYFDQKAYLKTDTANIRKDSLLTDSTLHSKKNYSLKPPPSFGFGASYQFTPEWFAAVDFDVVLWDRFYSAQSLINPVDNAFNFSAGVQYIPAPNLLTPRYFEIMQYRAGFRYTQLPVATASEFAFSLGVGLPIREGNGLIDISFEVGNRSDSRYKYNEQFFGIQLGFNAGQKWYQSAEQSY